MFYRQCELVRNNRKTTTWIPEQFAVMNKFLKLKEDGEWVDGWKVVGIYHRLDFKDVLRLEDAYKHQRDVSDI